MRDITSAVGVLVVTVMPVPAAPSTANGNAVDDTILLGPNTKKR